jgi:pyroglutamyl-peptidase
MHWRLRAAFATDCSKKASPFARRPERIAQAVVQRTNVLLTGFDPFDREALNPSWEAVRALDGWKCGRATVHARQMPCVFGDAIEALAGAMDELQPQLVLCIGQAGGRAEITPERVAINIDDGRIADNAGWQPIDTPVVRGAPAAYFSTLPIKAIVRDLRAAGVPASVSNTAGTFVCNHIFYGLMHRMATHPVQGLRGGFIHIPYLPEQAARFPGVPSMSLATMVEALRVAVATSLAVGKDIAETGGQLH